MSRFVNQSGRFLRSGFLLGLGTVAVGVTPAAAAPGDHIRVGVVEIIPRVGMGLDYHSNIYRTEVSPAPAASFQLEPGVSATASGDDHEFSGNGSWTLRKFLFVGGAPETRAERIANLDRFDNFGVGLGANLFKRSIVGLKLSNDTVLRNWTIDAPEAEVPYTTQFRNSLAGTLRTNPAPALEVSPTVGWTYDNFRAPLFTEDGDRSLNNRSTLGPKLDVKWAFLPRTAIVGHFDYANNSWSNNVLESEVTASNGGQFTIPNSNFVKGTVGIDGRFTERIFAQAFIGYGVGYFSADSVADVAGAAVDNASGLDGLLATLHLKYAIVPATETNAGAAVTLGYVKDFRSSFFTNYVSYNQLFAEFRGRFDDFEPSLRYEARFEGYSGAVARQDLVNIIRGGVGWLPADYVNLNANVGFLSRGSTDDTVDYNDVQLGLGATFLY